MVVAKVDTNHHTLCWGQLGPRRGQRPSNGLPDGTYLGRNIGKVTDNVVGYFTMLCEDVLLFPLPP